MATGDHHAVGLTNFFHSPPTNAKAYFTDETSELSVEIEVRLKKYGLNGILLSLS